MKWGYKVLLIFVCSLFAVLVLHAVIQYSLTEFIQWAQAFFVSVIFALIFAGISCLHFLFPPKNKSFLGMPYNFSKPTKKRVLNTYWNKDQKLFKPKLWGIGWDLNLRSPWALILIIAVVLIIFFSFYYQDKITKLDTSSSFPLEQGCEGDLDCVESEKKDFDELSITKVACESAGAFWNECSSPCLGTDSDMCTMNCVIHCECDAKTKKCPNGHVCRVGKFDLERGVCV